MYNNSHIKQDSRQSRDKTNRGHKGFVCRICRQHHPLRKCKRFLHMNSTKRQQLVKTYGYCKNCLAHSHSQGTCFTKTGCRYCGKSHHTLLHVHQRLHQSKNQKMQYPPHTSDTKKKSTQKETESTSKSNYTSLSRILKQNSTTLLPTLLLKIDSKNGNPIVRCLLDSGSKTSSISSKITDNLGLTTLTLDDETLCPATLTSLFDQEIQMKVALKVNNRISIHTPSKTISSSVEDKFKNIVLADPKFFKSAPIDVILGADVYSRVLSEGFLTRPGLPTAQNTIFGWVLCGLFSE